MKYLILIIFISIFYTTCKSPTNSPIPILAIDVKKVDENLSEVFESSHYVILETTEDNLIGNIDKLQFTDDRIYIFCRKTNTIFIFDNQGKYISKIARKGKGPEEYLSIRDFDIYDSDVYTLSRENKKIFVYSEDGSYINEYPLNDWYNYFKVLNDSLVYLYSGQSNYQYYNFILYNYKKEEYLNKFEPFEEYSNMSFSLTPFHFTSEKELLISQQYDHTIYKLRIDSYEPKYSFTFNTVDQIPKDYKKIPFSELLDKIDDKKITRRLELIEETENNLFITYTFIFDFETEDGRHFLAGQEYLSCIDKKNNSIHTVNLSGKFNPQFPFTSNPIAMQNGYLISSSLPSQEMFDRGVLSEEQAKLDDNPILFFYKLKE